MTSKIDLPVLRGARSSLLRNSALGGLGIWLGVYAAPAAAQTVCTAPAAGQIICPGSNTNATVNVTDSPTPLAVTLNDTFNSVTTLNASTLASSNLTVNSLGSSVVRTTNQPGAVLTSGSNLDARIGTLATTGDGATGAILTAADNLIFVSDGAVTTTGNLADGIDAQGRTVNVTTNVIRTRGTDADGAELTSLNGPITFRSNLIETTGGLSSATVLRGTGTINANVGVLRTSGGQAAGADISTAAAACVLLGQNGCNTTLNASEITTSGFGSVGALVSAVGDTTVNATLLQTGGDEAAGLSLSAVPSACVALGVGSCDTAFTVQNLTTNGARSPGALVRAAGDIDGRVTVLRTNGANAAGVDLASDPSACAVLGRGSCDTSFAVGQLTTSGAGATGALIRAAGTTTLSATALQTLGNNAPGIDIAADPTACVLLGAGACITNIDAGSVRTQGNGSAAVLASAPAQINAVLGQVSTSGSNATGVSLTSSPAACVVLGPGTCGINERSTSVTTTGPNSPGVVIASPGGPVNASPGDVTTTGPNSPGVVVTDPGTVTVTAGTVSTGGPASPGITVNGGEGPIAVTFTNVTTTGNNSPAVAVTGTGPVTVRGGNATTGGADSPGVRVRGDDDPVVVVLGNVSTGGPRSPAVSVTTSTGPQTIITGSVVATGAASDAIDAIGTGCANINILTNGPIASSSGIGINASTGCFLTITTGAASPVSGSVAGINAVSGTGAVISLGNSLSSSGGPALNVDGAPANVTVRPGGSITGFVDLTNGADLLTNNGVFNATGTSSFGGGNDTLVNNGVIAVRPGAAAPGTVTFASLETTANAGLIDLRNGQVGDRLALSGNFNGIGGSAVGLDVQATGGVGAADRLVIAGAAVGQTTLLINSLASQPGILLNGAVVVDAGPGTNATAFVLPATSAGFVDYSLAFAPAANDFQLFGTPSASAISQYKLTEGARQLFFRGNDAVGSHLQSLGDDADGGGAAGRADQAHRGSRALWGIMYGDYSKYRAAITVSPLSVATNVRLDYLQDSFGFQLGYDFGGVGDDSDRGQVIGITAGYANSELRFRANADRFQYDAVNAGLYGRATLGVGFAKTYVKYERLWINSVNRVIGLDAKTHGETYGAMGEFGLHLKSGGFFIEPAASFEVARTKIDNFAALNSSFDFDASNGARAKAGVRVGSNSVSGDKVTKVYAGVAVVKEWTRDSDARFLNSGFALTAAGPGIGTYGQAKAGFSVKLGERVSGFIEAHGEYSDHYRGGGGRGGLSIRF